MKRKWIKAMNLFAGTSLRLTDSQCSTTAVSAGVASKSYSCARSFECLAHVRWTNFSLISISTVPFVFFHSFNFFQLLFVRSIRLNHRMLFARVRRWLVALRSAVENKRCRREPELWEINYYFADDSEFIDENRFRHSNGLFFRRFFILH